EGDLGEVMRLEHGFHRCADLDELPRIAEQVAEHADVAGAGQPDGHHDVGAVILEGGVHGVPRTLPAVDDAPPLDALPAHVEGQAGVADPFRPPLPRVAAPAALDHQLTATRPLPVRLVQALGLPPRPGHPRPQGVPPPGPTPPPPPPPPP